MHKKVLKSALPQDQEPKVGMTLILATPDGNQFPTRIIAVNLETVTIDLNPPLAGKKLIFKIKIVELEKIQKANKLGF